MISSIIIQIEAMKRLTSFKVASQKRYPSPLYSKITSIIAQPDIIYAIKNFIIGITGTNPPTNEQNFELNDETVLTLSIFC